MGAITFASIVNGFYESSNYSNNENPCKKSEVILENKKTKIDSAYKIQMNELEKKKAKTDSVKKSYQNKLEEISQYNI